MYIKVQFLLVFAGFETFLNTCMPTFVDSKSGDVTVESVLRRLLKTVVEGTFLNMSIIVFLWGKYGFVRIRIFPKKLFVLLAGSED